MKYPLWHRVWLAVCLIVSVTAWSQVAHAQALHGPGIEGAALSHNQAIDGNKQVKRLDRAIRKLQKRLNRQLPDRLRERLEQRLMELQARMQELRKRIAERRAELRHKRYLRRKGWTLAYSDEFDGDAIDATKWSHEVNCWGGGNNERQCYTDRVENSFVQDGFLHIVAREESFSGPGVPDDDPSYNPSDTSVTLPFTSARLRSKGKMDFTYGRVEVRAKVPGGQGMWPAIWMLPSDDVYGGWPSSGEIDIFEAVNLGVWANEIHGTLHYGLKWPQWENHGATLPLAYNPADDFHTYAVEWEGDEIRWYLDGAHYQTQSSAGWYNYIWQGQDQGFGVANPRAPFDQDFHMILNVATGGDWPGNPDTGWTEDREMVVDYVRVYQCQRDLATGTGCATKDASVELNADAGAPGVNDYVLFADGPETVELDDGGTAFGNTLNPGYWELNEGSLTQSQIDLGGERGIVWDIIFGGLSNVFLTAQDMSSVDGYLTGMAMQGGSGWTTNGEIEFDLYVDSAAPDSSLVVKLDSGWPNQGQVAIELPEPGQWHKVAVRVADLMASPNPDGGGVDIANILNPFVLEYSGSGAAVRVDNVRLQCAFNTEPESWQLDQTCALTPLTAPVVPTTDEHDVYVDAVTDWQPFDCCGGSVITEVDNSGNPALQFAYDANPDTNTVTFFGLPVPRDMSHYAGGTLEFDINVIQQPSNPAATPWLIKVDCGTGCSTGDQSFTLSQEGINPSGGWQRFTFNVNDLVSRGLDLSKVSAIVIFPAWGNQDNALYQLDNVQWKVGSSAPPAGPFNVTFNVDMSGEGLSVGDTVYVSGNFNGWCQWCNPLVNSGADIWTTTLPINPGSYEFKYQLNGWASQEAVPAECGLVTGEFINRVLDVVDQDVALSVTPYGGCPSVAPPPPSGPYDVTFSVDMSGEGLAGGDVVYVSGSFNGWCQWCNPLVNSGADVWTTTLPINPGSYEYKYQLNGWASQEAVPAECGLVTGEFINRVLDVVDQPVALSQTAYGGCPTP